MFVALQTVVFICSKRSFDHITISKGSSRSTFARASVGFFRSFIICPQDKHLQYALRPSEHGDTRQLKLNKLIMNLS